MAESRELPDWHELLEAGMEFTALTRAEAERRAKRLVHGGQLAQERMQSFVDTLVRTSRTRADDLVDVVRKEIAQQVKVLGVATKRDLDRLERRVAKAEQTAARTARKAPKKAAAKANKKKATRKTPAKKATAKRSARRP